MPVAGRAAGTRAGRGRGLRRAVPHGPTDHGIRRRAPGERRRPGRAPADAHVAVVHADQAQPVGRGRAGRARRRSPAAQQAITPSPRWPGPGRPRPGSPTRERTIWWQNELGLDLEAQQAARRRARPGAASHARTSGRRATRRTIGLARRRCPGAAGRRPGSRARRAGGRRPRPWPAGRGARRRARPPGPSSGSGDRGVPDQVAVAAGGGRAAGVEAGGAGVGRRAPRSPGRAGG